MLSQSLAGTGVLETIEQNECLFWDPIQLLVHRAQRCIGLAIAIEPLDLPVLVDFDRERLLRQILESPREMIDPFIVD